MSLNRRTAVIGTAINVPVTAETHSHEELLYDLVQDALRDASLTIEQIDGIVVGSNDQFDGRAISVMAASGSVGGVDRDILSTPSAGEHAFVMGVLRVASKLYETQLVIAWSPTETDTLSEAQRLGADPYFHRHLPLDELNAAALQAAAMIGAEPDLSEVAERIADHYRDQGRRARGINDQSQPPLPWPLTTKMVSLPTCGLVAMVLASEEFVRDHVTGPVAWVEGMGWATEAAFLGDRDLTQADALRAACERAYAEAWIDHPSRDFEVVELGGATPFQDLLAARCLGLAPEALQGVIEGVAVNASGGSLAQNPVFCTGMMRIAEVANQVRGAAGAHQHEGVRRGLAQAGSGPAAMYQSVLVLGNDHIGGRA